MCTYYVVASEKRLKSVNHTNKSDNWSKELQHVQRSSRLTAIEMLEHKKAQLKEKERACNPRKRTGVVEKKA